METGNLFGDEVGGQFEEHLPRWQGDLERVRLCQPTSMGVLGRGDDLRPGPCWFSLGCEGDDERKSGISCFISTLHYPPDFGGVFTGTCHVSFGHLSPYISW